MINKIHSRGSGGGAGPVQYLLGTDGQREGSTLLRGDPELTIALIDSSKYAKKYTSGVLSFSEGDIPNEHKQQIMDSFERALLPSMDGDQYHCLWVEHQDKGRLELNYVIPNLELTSGKRLQPYYDRADRPRMNAWKDLINEKYGLSDPNDPAKRQALTLPSDLPRATQEAQTAITDGLKGMAAQGLISSREDVLSALEQGGFVIARETKSSISIENPTGGRNIRLKGALYERDFKLSEDLRGEIEAASSEYRENAPERIREARKVYQRGIEIKRAEIERRYPRQEPEDQAPSPEGVGMDDPQPTFGGGRQRRGPVVDRRKDSEEPSRDRAAASHDRPHQATDMGLEPSGEPYRAVYSTPEGYGGGYGLDMGQQLSNQADTGVNQGDGIRARAISGLRQLAERIHTATQRLGEGLQGVADDVRAHLSRDSGLEKAGRELNRVGGELEQAAQKMIQQREIEKARMPSPRGPSM